MVRESAVKMIQRAWSQFKMKRTFKWLRHNLFRTVITFKKERMLTREVLRRLAPNEGHLLSDPVLKTKIRFRLGGANFPPSIMYKVYTGGVKSHFFNGHDIIHAGSQV